MASNMEVEGQQQQPQQPAVFVHPLAIVHMSDQYTRVTCGGSPLPKTAPVIGLMFGTSTINNNDNNDMNDDDKNTNEIHIHDADDTIPLDDYSAEKQVALHQAVFPTHTTVGWYRVVLSTPNNDNQGPTVSDLQQTQRLRQKYPGQEILFGLLQVPNSDAVSGKKKAAASTSSDPMDQKRKATHQQNDDDDDDDDELPLTLYQIVGGAAGAQGQNNQGQVLVAVEDWKIATSEAERIAVERVISEKPAKSSNTSASTTTATLSLSQAAVAAAGGEAAAIRAATEAAQESSAFIQQTTHIQESWRAIQDRLAILVTFLETVQKEQQNDAASASIMTVQEYHEQQSLLRQVQGLLLQLGPLAASCPTSAMLSSSKTTSLQQLSVLAKTIDAVTSYTDKFRLVQDSMGPGREVRRF